jgi:hypothetical protein
MKKIIYIGLFTVLGVMVGVLLHALIDLIALKIDATTIVPYLEMYRRGWGVLLFVIGGLTGFMLGKKFWQILYVEKRYGTPRI